jgi:hypothetical protein
MGIGALGAAGLSACSATRGIVLEPGVMPLDMSGFLEQLDERMNALRGARFVEGFVRAAGKKPADSETSKVRGPGEVGLVTVIIGAIMRATS